MNEKKVILVIEDDQPTTRVMRLILQPEGHVLIATADRGEALIALVEQKPALVIMDYLIDGLGASEFLQEARALGFQGPILLCTAMHEDLGLPVNDVLLKPFDPDVLVQKVSFLLESQESL